MGYDALGRLHKIDINGTVTEQLYDGDDLVAEYGTDGTLLRRYVHGPGTDEPITRYEGDGTAAKLWLYTDHQGSIVAAANTAGNMATTHSYGPFGEPDRVGGLKHRYTGQQWLAGINLYYYKARMYSPTLGRFLQTDPIGYGDGLNLYAYVGNNPINFTDPSGLYAGEMKETAGAFLDAAEKNPAIGLTLTAPLTFINPGIRGLTDPSKIRFTQDSISGSFKNGGSKIQSLIDGLKSGKILPENVAPIRTFQKDGLTYSLDNRRLFAAIQAGVKIKTVPATAKEIAKELPSKFTTPNQGCIVCIKGSLE